MDFKLPDIGEGIHEGEITKWLVKEGDRIEADQPMVEVMTDKATVEIPSPVSGLVEAMMAKEGETIEVGRVLLRIRESGNGKAQASPGAGESPRPSLATPASAAPPSAPERRTVQAPIQEEARAAPPSPPAHQEVVPFHVLATPATRKLARDLHIGLETLRGSGPHGRVTKLDVQMAYEGQQAAAFRSSHPAPRQAEIGTALSPRESQTSVAVGTVSRVPLRGIRKRTALAMAQSKRTAAHFTFVEEVDMTEVVSLRKAQAEEAARRAVKLTYLPFIIKALIPALKEFPYLNSSLDEQMQEIVLKGSYHLGIATDTPNGLMVPVIQDADRKSIWELATDIATLSERARSGKSLPTDLKGGTFTITNAGNIGGVFATPVINYPEVAILGVNSIRKRPMVHDDAIVIREMMFLSLSVDHRVVDGADAARFMNRLIYFLSEPTRLVFA